MAAAKLSATYQNVMTLPLITIGFSTKGGCGAAALPRLCLVAAAIQRRLAPSLLALIPINAQVVRLPAHGNDVDLAVAVEVGGGEVLDGHAAVIDNLPSPFLALAVGALVDTHAAALREFVARLRVGIVAHADD